MKRMILIFLLLCGSVYATNYYVAQAVNGGASGNNGRAPTDEGGGVGPKLYLQNAIDLINAGGTHTIVDFQLPTITSTKGLTNELLAC